MRQKRYLYSLLSSLCAQIVSVICGIILPRVLLKNYGSQLYGATRSITQFLGYIALLEGGISGVARAALYKPLAEKDNVEVGKIIFCIRSFYRKIALFFSASAMVIACSYKWIARGNTFDWLYSFFLVVVIAISSMAEYYFGSAYDVLLHADQKKYIYYLLSTGATFFNTVFSCILAWIGMDMIFLKIAWCGIHIIRLMILNWYIHQVYQLKEIKTKKDYLPQKRDGLGQHIAYFFQTNTDIIIITVFISLTEVSVYSIYNNIITCLSALVLTLNANVEAVFGDMLAKREFRKLKDFFDQISFMISSAVSICFSVAAGLIIPFIRLYTSGINDAEYIRPNLAMLMLLIQVVYCLKHPYHEMTIAAGHFKETKKAAFIEAGLNIGLSVLLTLRWGTEGVVMATLTALIYRATFFVLYLKNHILHIPSAVFIKRILVTLINIVLNVKIFVLFADITHMQVKTIMEWIYSAMVSTILAVAVTFLFSFIFYHRELYCLIKRIR